MGGSRYLTWRAENGRWRHKRLSPNKDSVAFWVKHGSIKQQERWEQEREGAREGRQKEAQSSQGIQHSGLPFRDVGEVATRVSGTAFWVKALPTVMTSFSRASFDWAVHFPPQWMHAARPPLMLWMSLQIIHGWQTGEQVALQSIQLGSAQCHSKETEVEWEE